MAELPIPDFYDPAHAGEWSYRSDQQRLFEAALAWRAEHGIRPSSSDERRVQLLLIDLQKDFCFPEGALFVGGRSGRGAVEDNDRVARFIYRNLGAITDITCTLDTHSPHQIFSPSFWLDREGNPPTAHREVTAEEVRAGELRPNPALAAPLAGGDYEWLRRQALFYCEELERQGKYRLYLWPPHCILGSDGQALAGVVHEARMFHAYARVARARTEVKGEMPLTEYYSVLGPEVDVWHEVEGPRPALRGVAFLELLMSSAAVIVAGQAASHCVKATIEDLLGQIDRDLASKVYLLRDCMSAVAVPDASRPGAFAFDFTDQAEMALARFEREGMHVVSSMEDVEDWLSG